jgi:hypothetical protein
LWAIACLPIDEGAFSRNYLTTQHFSLIGPRRGKPRNPAIQGRNETRPVRAGASKLGIRRRRPGGSLAEGSGILPVRISS